MKALVKAKAEEGIWLQDMPEPECCNNDVIVKIHKTAICGTDIHIYNWDEWAQKTIPVPMITGHEYAGEIVEVGQNVTDLSVGDIVSGEGHITCGRCRNCLAGRIHLCPNTIGVGVNRTELLLSTYLFQQKIFLSQVEKSQQIFYLYLTLMVMQYTPPYPSIWWVKMF